MNQAKLKSQERIIVSKEEYQELLTLKYRAGMCFGMLKELGDLANFPFLERWATRVRESIIVLDEISQEEKYE